MCDNIRYDRCILYVRMKMHFFLEKKSKTEYDYNKVKEL